MDELEGAEGERLVLDNGIPVHERLCSPGRIKGTKLAFLALAVSLCRGQTKDSVRLNTHP